MEGLARWACNKPNTQSTAIATRMQIPAMEATRATKIPTTISTLCQTFQLTGRGLAATNSLRAIILTCMRITRSTWIATTRMGPATSMCLIWMSCGKMSVPISSLPVLESQQHLPAATPGYDLELTMLARTHPRLARPIDCRWAATCIGLAGRSSFPESSRPLCQGSLPQLSRRRLLHPRSFWHVRASATTRLRTRPIGGSFQW
mmetsp:Transcript_74199/g.174150  ORF Transcript_74199/g.174150 Transcript_74199/m.174150 type:complete len:204 (+) Transcript_74199:428-1039(+)